MPSLRTVTMMNSLCDNADELLADIGSCGGLQKATLLHAYEAYEGSRRFSSAGLVQLVHNMVAVGSRCAVEITCSGYHITAGRLAEVKAELQAAGGGVQWLRLVRNGGQVEVLACIPMDILGPRAVATGHWR